MKNRNLLLGVIVLFVGVIALLATLGVFTFRWTVAWHLWPMLLVITGIMVLPVKDWLKALLVVAALLISVFLYRYEDAHSWSWLHWLFCQVF